MANKNPDTSGLKPPWSATNQPKGAGRKPSKLKKYIKDNNLNMFDIQNMVKFIFPMTHDEIVKMCDDPKIPESIKAFGMAVIRANKKGNVKDLSTLMEWGFGKPKERIELSGGIETKPTFHIVDKEGNELPSETPSAD